MSEAASPELNDCGCCEGVKDETPVDIFNGPGLTQLAYRVGTHSRFKESMQVDLTRHPPLLALKTRRDDDPTIGLLDGWATVLDVLTFYQERMANEGYLRTGTERRSLLELARSIGYELRPGVAASTYLMFTMETAAGAPREAIISVGTKAQSIPEQDEQAQTFETIEEITGRPAWNELLPRLTQPQRLRIHADKLEYRTGTEVRVLYFQGTNTGLTPGDRILITRGSAANTRALSKRVLRVKTDDEAKQTKVEIETTTANPGGLPLAQPTAFFDPVPFPPNAPLLPFNDENITKVLALHLRERDLQTFLEVNRWNAGDLAEYVQTRAATRAVPRQAAFAFRERVGFFGNNAPANKSLRDNANTPLFATNWDDPPWKIWEDYPDHASYSNADAFLERSVAGIVPGGWAYFSGPGLKRIYSVVGVTETSLSAFAINGKATGLSLKNADNSVINKTSDAFLVRKTTAYVKSEPLALAAVPISDVISAGTAALEVEEMVLGLKRGQLIVLSGEQKDAPGVIRQELVALTEIIHFDGRSTIFFQEESAGAGLLHSYVRKTVKINANVARATQGETKREVLGSGDAAQAFQKFALKQAPVTYVSAPTSTGLASTLQLRVNDVLWEESPTLYRVPASERTFVTRRTDEGKTSAQFGDGVTGARLPSGVENVTATYRVGLGLGGMVKAKQISLLLTRSLGLKEVVNPLPASGGADAETRDDARENAPFTVLTLDRIVSMQDFEDYARAYPGIGKAQAIWLWQGEHKIIHITIAGADGGPISTVSALYKNLRLSMENVRDPGPRVQIASFVPLTFNVQAKLLVTPGYLTDKVQAAVTAAVVDAFSFHRRSFGQAVTKSELYSVMQGVEGVDAVDLDKLYLGSNVATLEDRLPARTAGWDQTNTTVRAAELLLVNPREIKLTEMPA